MIAIVGLLVGPLVGGTVSMTSIFVGLSVTFGFGTTGAGVSSIGLAVGDTVSTTITIGALGATWTGVGVRVALGDVPAVGATVSTSRRVGADESRTSWRTVGDEVSGKGLLPGPGNNPEPPVGFAVGI